MVSDSGTGDLAGDPGSGKLWAGITALYAEPGVAEACLAAQDEAGADVLLLLAAALRARDGISLQGAGPALAAAAEPWRSEVVRPLRGLRRRWRGLDGVEPLRERLKVLELEAERAQFERLAPLLAGPPAEATAALLRANLAAVEPSLSREHLDVLVAALLRGWRPAPGG
ncbi:MAG TPA: TIGR02444 family protein [Halieaceae bacterium]|nr:TIGR02444 family protein [Halieaceae bacterium]